MPAKRLPWLKFWPELVDHRKFAELSDAERWTWVKCLARAGQQPIRGQFGSIKHASEVTGRPVAHIRRLVAVKLLDESPEGLLMHDWEEWQRWRPGDTNDEPTPPQSPPDQHANDSRTPTDEHANPEPKKGEERRETEKEIPEAHTQQVRARVDKPRQRVTVVDEAFEEAMVVEYVSQFGSGQAVRDCIADALGHNRAKTHHDQQAYVRNWLRREVGFARERAPRLLRHPSANGRPLPRDVAAYITEDLGVTG